MIYGSPAFWRETHKQVRFVIFDGRIFVVWLLMIMHLRVWTVLLAIGITFGLFLLERKGVSADSALRFMRASFAGRRRTARGIQEERRPIDFGYETEKDVQDMEKLVAERQRQHEVRLENEQEGQTGRSGWRRFLPV